MRCHEPISAVHASSHDPPELLFRCNICTRAAHYSHLPQPNEDDPVDLGTLAFYYQDSTAWKCHDCASFVYPLDKIIAWRPYPAGAKDPDNLDYASSVPREYLVKWTDRSYNRVQWVPHMWLLATNRQNLRKFVLDGRTVKLIDQAQQLAEEKEAVRDKMMMDVDNEEMAIDDELPSLAQRADLLAPVMDAKERINPAWRTVDRVLDALLFKRPTKKLKIRLEAQRKPIRVDSDEELDPDTQVEYDSAFDHGEQPADEYTETIAQWEKRNHRKITQDQAGDVVWALFKWGDLGYEDSTSSFSVCWCVSWPDRDCVATWDAPPREGDAGRAAFERAFTRFVHARSIAKPKGPIGLAAKKRPKDHFMKQSRLKEGEDLELGQESHFKLMNFQVFTSIRVNGSMH